MPLLPRLFSPLTRLRGVQPLTAGALAGLLGPGRRLRTDAPLAASAGGAPLEAASAGAGRHRLTRGGTRRLHAVRHRSAVTQAGASPQARASRARRHAEGRSKREAVRARKRFLARALWRLWLECLAQRPAAPVPAA